jgi:hypothetical protein
MSLSKIQLSCVFITFKRSVFLLPMWDRILNLRMNWRRRTARHNLPCVFSPLRVNHLTEGRNLEITRIDPKGDTSRPPSSARAHENAGRCCELLNNIPDHSADLAQSESRCKARL